jgi:hypothetical protein
MLFLFIIYLLIYGTATFLFSDSVHACPLLWRSCTESYKSLSTVANARTDIECCYHQQKKRKWQKHHSHQWHVLKRFIYLLEYYSLWRIRVNCHKHNDLYNYIQKKKNIWVSRIIFFVILVSRSLTVSLVEYK